MKKWYVIYTKPQQELVVADQLTSMGIKNYCPTIKLIKQYSDRKKKIIKPLIPSYVMIFLDEKNRNIVFSLKGVVRYLFFLGKRVEVKEEEIRLMKDHLNGVYNDFTINSLTKGDDYKISEGPFAGFKGTVLETDSSKIKLAIRCLALTVVLRKEAA